QLSGLQTEVLNGGGEFGVRFECFGRLGAGETEVAGTEEDDGLPIVDEGGLDGATSGEDQFVASAAGGQQRGGDRSRGIAEEDGDRTAGAVDSIDHGAAFEFDDSITVSAERGADCDLCNEAGVERPHSYGRQVLNGG